MRAMLRTGRYISPVDGRKGTAENGSKLTEAMTESVRKALESNLKQQRGYTSSRAESYSDAIDKLYKENAARLGMSLSEFKRGTSSIDALQSRISEGMRYKRWDMEHSTYSSTGVGSGDYSVTTEEKNPYDASAVKWTVFKDDSELFKELSQLIQQSSQWNAQVYSQDAQAFRSINTALTRMNGGGGTSSPSSKGKKDTWALIPMQEVGMVGIGRSIDDVNKDISRSQKQYNSALTEFDRLEALNSLEGYQKELAAMKGGGAFANAYGYDFQKDIDRNAKSMEKDDKEEKKNDKSVAEGVGQMVGGIQNMVGSLEQLGVTLPEGMGQLLNGIMAVVSLMQAVTTILTAIQAISAADAVIPFARGGMVRAAQGVFVPGNSMSGDRVPALLNSGEVVFNRAQQGNLVSQMRDSRYDSMMEMQPYVDGEKVLLGVNNYLRRSGRGEIVTSKRG